VIWYLVGLDGWPGRWSGRFSECDLEGGLLDDLEFGLNGGLEAGFHRSPVKVG
jgi:hypothetical protein